MYTYVYIYIFLSTEFYNCINLYHWQGSLSFFFFPCSSFPHLLECWWSSCRAAVTTATPNIVTPEPRWHCPASACWTETHWLPGSLWQYWLLNSPNTRWVKESCGSGHLDSAPPCSSPCLILTAFQRNRQLFLLLLIDSRSLLRCSSVTEEWK